MLNMELPYDLAITLLGTYPRQLNTCAHTKTSFAWMFIAMVLMIAQKQKQSKCPSTDQWINNMWYIHAMKYYLATKRNELPIHVKTWMNLKNILSYDSYDDTMK